MKKISLLLAFALILGLAGCGAEQGAKPQTGLIDYDLGEGTLLESGGGELSYEIQGVLGIPEEEGCPVVVIIHGAHPIEKAAETRYDKGFEYLAQSLSEQGSLVMSMNVAINYSFENGEPNGNERTKQVITQQLALLKKALEGDESVFGCDLSGKGDLSKIIFVGHSRGGLDVLEYMQAMPEGMAAAGAVCAAPSEYKVMETAFPNVPIGIIIPQRDGDVVSLDGSNIYEEIIADEQYSGTAELIYLKNANHGYFNTLLTEPDLNHTEAELELLMPPRQQRDFLSGYVADFVKSAVSGGRTVFADSAELLSSAYGCEVLLRVHSGADELLWRADSGDALLCTGGAAETKEIFSPLPEKNTVGTFRMPTLSAQSYAVRHVIWDGADSGVTIPVADLSGGRFLDIDMALDSTDARNKAGQTMTLVFTQTGGGEARCELSSDTAALLWQEGTLNEQVGWDGETVQEYSTFTPLVTLRVDLTKLEGVELSALESLQMTWASTSGSVMLRSASLVA